MKTRMTMDRACFILQSETQILNGVHIKPEYSLNDILEANNVLKNADPEITSLYAKDIYNEYLVARNESESNFKNQFNNKHVTKIHEVNLLLTYGDQSFQNRLSDKNALNRAFKNYTEALQLALKQKNNEKICEAYICIGRCYQANNQLELAKDNYSQAFKISPRKIDKNGKEVVLFYEIVKNLERQKGKWNVSITPPKTLRMDLIDYMKKNNSIFDVLSTEKKTVVKLIDSLKHSAKKSTIELSDKEINILSKGELASILKKHIAQTKSILPKKLSEKLIEERGSSHNLKK